MGWAQIRDIQIATHIVVSIPNIVIAIVLSLFISFFLFKDGKIQAVLDWCLFLLGDPAMDVANTIFLITIPSKLLSPDLDTKRIIEMYLNAYRKKRPLDETNIAYYVTVRSVRSLIDGAKGHVLLGRPEIIQLLLASIYENTGVKIKIPSSK